MSCWYMAVWAFTLKLPLYTQTATRHNFHSRRNMDTEITVRPQMHIITLMVFRVFKYLFGSRLSNSAYSLYPKGTSQLLKTLGCPILFNLLSNFAKHWKKNVVLGKLCRSGSVDLKNIHFFWASYTLKWIQSSATIARSKFVCRLSLTGTRGKCWRLPVAPRGHSLKNVDFNTQKSCDVASVKGTQQA